MDAQLAQGPVGADAGGANGALEDAGDLGKRHFLEAAEEQARRTLAISERMGLSHFFGGISQLLMNCLAYQGRLDEARGWGQRGLDWTTSRGDRWFLSYVESYLSVTEFLANNYLEAERHARSAVESATDKPPLRPFTLALLARARLAQGFVNEALALAKDAYEAIDSKVPLEDGEASVRLAYAEALAASGNWFEAKRVISDAMDWLHRRAETLDDPTMRPGFLERIPEHRRIRELAAELGVAAKAA